VGSGLTESAADHDVKYFVLARRLLYFVIEDMSPCIDARAGCNKRCIHVSMDVLSKNQAVAWQ
jgi:hypothetical protein